jgi:hypothetical protein
MQWRVDVDASVLSAIDLAHSATMGGGRAQGFRAAWRAHAGHGRIWKQQACFRRSPRVTAQGRPRQKSHSGARAGEPVEIRRTGESGCRTSRNAVFRASPFVEAAIIRERPGSSASWDLYPISFSDLQKGDTISVLAREQEGLQKALIGLMAVTGFGSYGINALPSRAPAFWFLDPLKAAR